MPSATNLSRNNEAYQRFSAAVEVPLLALAVIWLPVLIWPLVTKPTPAIADGLDAIDYFVWAAFTAEYIIKLYLAPSRGHFVKTHLLDLVVIAVPLLRPVRALRILRFLRLGRGLLVAGEILSRAKAILTHKGLHFVLLAVLLLVFIGAALELSFENTAHGSNIHDYGSALWWAVVTVTTVGYGDHYPVTAAGRGMAVLLMIVGIGLVGVITATMASFFIEQKKDADIAEVQQRLDRIEGLLTTLALNRKGDGPPLQHSSDRPFHDQSISDPFDRRKGNLDGAEV